MNCYTTTKALNKPVASGRHQLTPELPITTTSYHVNIVTKQLEGQCFWERLEWQNEFPARRQVYSPVQSSSNIPRIQATVPGVLVLYTPMKVKSHKNKVFVRALLRFNYSLVQINSIHGVFAKPNVPPIYSLKLSVNERICL